MNKFDLAPVFSEEEFKHWFIPRPGIVDSFVVEVGKGILITNVNSVFSLIDFAVTVEYFKLNSRIFQT